MFEVFTNGRNPEVHCRVSEVIVSDMGGRVDADFDSLRRNLRLNGLLIADAVGRCCFTRRIQPFGYRVEMVDADHGDGVAFLAEP